jgi:hypothetical protein
MTVEPSVLIHEQPNMSFGGGIPTVGKWAGVVRAAAYLLTVVLVCRAVVCRGGCSGVWLFMNAWCASMCHVVLQTPLLVSPVASSDAACGCLLLVQGWMALRTQA